MTEITGICALAKATIIRMPIAPLCGELREKPLTVLLPLLELPFFSLEVAIIGFLLLFKCTYMQIVQEKYNVYNQAQQFNKS